MYRRAQKLFLIALAGVIFITQLLAYPSIAKAQMVVSDPALLGLETTREVKTTFTNTLLAAGLGALINGTSYFMRKLAYDTARFVASGGKGQGALAFRDGFGTYLQKEAGNAGASAIGQFGAPFGLNLCKPPDIRTTVFLQVGLRSIYDLEFGAEGGPQPSCKWSDFSRDWGAAIENPGAYGKDLLTENFAASINVSQTDFGVALGFQNKIDRIVSQGQIGASNERLEGQGFKSLTGLISGQVKTPAQVISEETKAVTGKHQGELSAGQIAGIYGSGAAQILPMAAGVFLNTLVSQLLNNLLTEGLFPDTPGAGTSAGTQGGGFGGQFAGPLSINRERAEAAFSFLFTAVPTKELSSFNIAQLVACPDSPGIYNCVIDTAFQQAIDRARTKPLTIREAIDQTLLHGDWPLISPRREVDNTNIKGCRDKGYCYSNLQKLRKLRIVPLGFEIAALNADPDNLEVWTLKKVVDSFEDCARDQFGNAVADPAHPFCHLIDPNWIIKAPDARCEAEGYGNQLAVAGGAERLKECLDVSTCVKEGPNGSCESFSYCTREKNVWKIPAKACAAYNATCRTYVDDNNQIASYLSRTLDFGECTAESVGCRAYSAEQRAGAWQNSNQAQAQLALKALGRPQAVYFNDQIQNQTCPSSADGCSAFYEALLGGEQGGLAYFKKAPDYLGCYDIDPSPLHPEVNYPSTEAELTLLRNKPAECANFSSACIPEEVACELYTPEDGGVDITGIVGGNVCASECVGYDAYKQEATNFESSKFPLYFVPSNGRTCEARNVGCDEFTNLDNPRGGGELREYYSDLKYCEKPAAGIGKTFYSWEGSEREGYILRRHTLLQINEASRAYIDGLQIAQGVKDAFPLGSAAYYDDSPVSLTSNHEICNQANYNILVNNPNSLDAAHPDCRALYDDQGAISYRMLTKTVTVSDQCHRLRKTESELYVDASLAGNQAGCSAKGGQLMNNQCQRCFSGGRLDNGACVYQGIVAESASCPGSANQCRSYIGNTGNNIQEVYFTSFEPAGEGQNALSDAKAGWNIDARVRPEATQVGLYSLEAFQGGAGRVFPAGTFEPGAWYELTFWAKGVQQNFQVTVRPQDGQELRFHESNLSFGPSWREYRVGPVQFTGNANQEVRLLFMGSGNSVFYLDNVRLTKFTDHIYLIKNSWRTPEGFDAPLSCDSIPNDGFPGEALGCRAYKDSAGERVTFTGFEKLCRAEAVGCRPFYDTKNTIEDTGVVAFNLWCRGNPGTCTIGQNLGSCTVPQGERGCYVEKVVMPDGVDTVAEMSHPQLQNAEVRPATIIIPADTPPNDPVYLARRQEFICSAEHLGCQKVALEEQVLPTANNAASYQFSDTYLKAGDPKHYETTLCSDTAVGCGEFKSANEIVYFKDPRIVGNKLCAYLPSRGEGANQRAGWYVEGVGKCSNNPANLCRTNEDCGGVECSLREPVACYPDYVLDDNEYGMWSQRTPNYAGYVGQCPLEENGCSEFLDPADVSDINPVGKPYYVIADEALNRNTSECNGRVSQKEGCVLFDRTDIPNKLYNAQATYVASENAPVRYSFVAPVSTPRNNTNVILKVNRDRECSEWLDCKTSLVQRNPDTGRATDVCYELKSCRKLGPGGECLEWVDTRLDTERLNEDTYVVRNTSWYDEEYTGYSLFNKYNPSGYINVSFANDDVFYLAYRYDALLLADFPDRDCTIIQNGRPANAPDFATKCGQDNGGRCYKVQCIYPVDGVFPNDVDIESEIKGTLAEERGLCKAHAESNSPFSNRDVVDSEAPALHQEDIGVRGQRYEYLNKKQDYNGVTVCNDITGEGCSCEYTKVVYKSGAVDFWPTTSTAPIPFGVCVGGGKDGLPCDRNEQCAERGERGALGVCSTKRNENKFVGLRGFCLEYDRSRSLGEGKFACQTWLPVDASATKLDNFNNDPSTGYYPALDAHTPSGDFGQIYCTDSNAEGRGVMYDFNKAYTFDLRENFVVKEGSLFGLGGIHTATDFHHDTENFEGDQDVYPHMVGETVASWARLHPALGPRAVVTDVAALNKWVELHDISMINNYWAYVRNAEKGESRQSDSPHDACPRGFDCGDSPDRADRIVLSGPVQDKPLRLFPRNFYEREVEKIYYTPFLVLGGLTNGSQGGRKDGEANSLYFTDKVFIDIEKLRNSNIGEIENILGGVVAANNVNYNVRFMRRVLDERFGWPGGVHRIVTFRADPQIAGSGDVVYGIMVITDNQADAIDGNQQTIKSCMSYIIGHPDEGDGFNLEAFLRDCNFVGAFKGIRIDADGRIDDDPVNWNRLVECEPNCVANLNSNESIYLAMNPGFASVYLLKGKCVEFSLADDRNRYLIPESKTFNKAWTDRVWADSQVNLARLGNRDIRYQAFKGVLTLLSQYHPYSSLGFAAQDFVDLVKLGKQVFDRKTAESSDSSVPFACQAPSVEGGLTLDPQIPPVCQGKVEADLVNCLSFARREYGLDITATSTCSGLLQNYGEYIDKDRKDLPAPGDPQNGGKIQLDQLFIMSFSKKRSDNIGGFTDPLPRDNSTDSFFVGQGIIPTVYSLNPYTCFGDENRENCSAAEANSFSVNHRNFNSAVPDYNGDGQRDEDSNRNGISDPIIERQSKVVALDFFALADDNRMPIRRVKISWGDGSVLNEERLGYYKNRKPFCATETKKRCVGTQVTCTQDADTQDADCAFLPGAPLCVEGGTHFGDADRACENTYFEFTHHYTCQEGDGNDTVTVAQLREGNGVPRDIADIAREAADRLRRMENVEETTPVCVFRPKVQVLDNWGWCNGSCNDPTTNRPYPNGGCYDNYSSRPQQLQCSRGDEDSKAWTEYKGAIFVIKG